MATNGKLLLPDRQGKHEDLLLRGKTQSCPKLGILADPLLSFKWHWRRDTDCRLQRNKLSSCLTQILLWTEHNTIIWSQLLTFTHTLTPTPFLLLVGLILVVKAHVMFFRCTQCDVFKVCPGAGPVWPKTEVFSSKQWIYTVRWEYSFPHSYDRTWHFSVITGFELL